MLCLDEKTGLQALERLSPTLPLRPGLVERQEFEYLRHGTVKLLAAFDVGTGTVFAQCDQRHTNLELRHFLRALRIRDPHSRWHLILDNARSHKKQAVLAWCAAVAVGTPVTRRPPHRFRRTVFPHRALR